MVIFQKLISSINFSDKNNPIIEVSERLLRIPAVVKMQATSSSSQSASEHHRTFFKVVIEAESHELSKNAIKKLKSHCYGG